MDDLDDMEDIDTPCPNCNAPTTRTRSCSVFGCEDGYVDEHEDDAINYAPGEEYSECGECFGFGALHWCPACGYDMNLKRVVK